MHHYQKSILDLFSNGKPIPLKLRFIAKQIDAKNPQTVKHHLQKLENNGLIQIDTKNKLIYLGSSQEEDGSLVSLPKMGQANCGFALSFAENTIEGYLRISRRLLPTPDTNSLFVLEAKGDSMNKADIDGTNIEDGDYVVVKETREIPNNNDYVVSVIDGRANIKKFFYQSGQIALMSESSKNMPPIFIDSSEWSTYRAVGKVIRVIKTPR